MKYYHIKLFSFISLLLVAGSGYASNWHKAVRCADKKAQKKYYAYAAEKYEHLLHSKCLPADSAYTVKIKLANCYMKTGNTIKAEYNYADVVNGGKADAEIIFCYARSLESNGKYADAKEWFDKLAADKSVADKNPKGFSEKCEKAIKTTTSENKYAITRASFNTTASEYAPAYYLKGLAFTSNQGERFVPAHKTMWNKQRFTHIYTVQEDNKGDLKAIDKLPAPINSKLNDGAACFNAAYDEVFFTRNNKHCKQHDQLQILSSRFNGTEWSRPKVLSFEISGVSYAHPALSPDGKTLYFSSDLPGGHGGMDLYMARRSGYGWEAPTNLGSLVNTSGNEIFPFLAADSTLYFTSDGLPGYGGMDLFHSKIKDGRFAKPENMGVNFNSSKDDLSLIVDSKNRTGYFASDRDGDDDIYSFRLPVKKPNMKEGQEIVRTIKVTDKTTGNPLAGTRVEISKPGQPEDGTFYYTNENGELHYIKKIDSADDIRVMKDKYKIKSFNAGRITDGKLFDISLEPDMVEEPVKLNFTTLYYDVNKSDVTGTIREQLRPVIDAMKSSPNDIVFIGGYADEQGGDTYNYELSKRRVNEVTNYLSAQGVELTKVHSSFYGAVKLSDECRKKPDCVIDTDRQNRRVEIYIINQK